MSVLTMLLVIPVAPACKDANGTQPRHHQHVCARFRHRARRHRWSNQLDGGSAVSDQADSFAVVGYCRRAYANPHVVGWCADRLEIECEWQQAPSNHRL